MDKTKSYVAWIESINVVPDYKCTSHTMNNSGDYIIRKYDSDGYCISRETITANGNKFYYKFNTDESNGIEGETYQNGKLVEDSLHKYEYDSDGNIISKVVHTFTHEPSWDEYDFSQKDKLIVTSYSVEDGQTDITSTVTIDFIPDTDKVKQIHGWGRVYDGANDIVKENVLTSSITVEYNDESGNISRVTDYNFTDFDNSYLIETFYTYNLDGKLIGRHMVSYNINNEITDGYTAIYLEDKE